MKTVLVVDDSLTERRLLSTYLQQVGLTVLSAASAEEAMEKVNHHPPELIILDVIMGGKSGFEMCRKLKSDQTTKSIPVIICSSKCTAADKMLGKALGADEYVGKPVDQAEFLRKVKAIIAV
ncbi:MAG: response regulator [Gomphosphaeria aponina SAG 52.96 = DSM 107014]|uniref:Response regulator n=1 Tax=Gomphosphaeria aponina SAG 52.96 = DSM 107014 TaxID=1521640 RepID=A0A941GNE6_9CHRO|nr:response regulator [Gomphosphaeria aponina SAG 52.96 = DSM 107014]